MNDTKPFYQSNGFWASMAQIVVSVGGASGGIDNMVGQELLADGPGFMVMIATGLAGVWSLIGRIRATSKLGM